MIIARPRSAVLALLLAATFELPAKAGDFIAEWGSLFKVGDQVRKDPSFLAKNPKLRFRNPDERESADGVLDVELAVRIADFSNVVEDRRVRLRTYLGKLVGPTLRVKPGDELRINLKNHAPLKADDPLGDESNDEGGFDPKNPNHNVPNNFGSTNLHTHGLKVSPLAPEDDVLNVDVAPGKSYQYSFKIPADHPAGTFWYHPHRHGSTAHQLCNGMAGALIVDPGLNGPPAIDQIEPIKAASHKDREKIMIFQEIRCSIDKAKAKPKPLIFNPLTYKAPLMFPARRDVYGFPDAKFESHKRFLINGQYQPVIVMKPGEYYRWRCVHAGIDRALQLGIMIPGTEFPLNCVAVDGLALPSVEEQMCNVDPFDKLGRLKQAKQRDRFRLLPGERADFLVGLNPGIYFLVASELAKDDNNREESAERLPLAVIHVPEFVPEPGRDEAPDLPNIAGLKLLDRPAPQTDDKTPRRIVQFRTQAGKYEVRHGMGSDDSKLKEADWREFDAAAPPLKVQAGTTEIWTLQSKNGPHPFHIHVNPFWIMERKGARDLESEKVHCWRDTVLIGDRETVTVAMAFDPRFSGETVLHCHNLDHEDKGMMMKVSIEDPARPKKQAGMPRLPLPAPDWALLDRNRKEHALKDYAGRETVLVFVKGIDCLHCSAQLRSLAKNFEAIQRAGLAVVAVCPDSTDDIKGIDKLPFPLLSDASLEVFQRYGVASHGTFRIDRLGVVRWQHVGEEPYMDIPRLIAGQP